MAKENIIFKEILGPVEKTISYQIDNSELLFIETSMYVDPKESMFKDNIKLTYKLDSDNTKKLLELLKEKELEKKFGNKDGFYEFREFIDANSINHTFISEDI